MSRVRYAWLGIALLQTTFRTPAAEISKADLFYLYYLDTCILGAPRFICGRTNAATLLTRTIFLMIVGLGAAPHALAQTSAPSVLIINQTDASVPFWSNVHSTIRSALTSAAPGRFAIYEEYLDLNRFRGTRYDEILPVYFREKYAGKHIDVIVSLGSLVLENTLRLRGELGTETPLVFAMTDAVPLPTGKRPPHTTGTFMQFSLHDMVTAARLLVPELNQVALVGDPYERQAARRAYGPQSKELASQLQVVDLTGLAVSELKRRLAVLPPTAAILYTGIYTDGDGAHYVPREALAILAKTANRPIVIESDTHLGYGGTGGFIVSSKLVGEAVAAQVLRILAGESAAEMPFVRGEFRKPMFDWRELSKWNISESSLPPGSEIRFRSPMLLDEYRWLLTGAGLVLLIQAGMISALLVERHRRRVAEVKSHGRLLEVMHLSRTAAAGALSGSIAHELNQPLGAIMSNAEAAELLLGMNPPDIGQLKEILADIRQADQHAADIIQHLRKLLKRTTDIELQEFDLNMAISDALHILSAEARKRNVALSATGIEQPLPVRADKVHLLQVILNLATNGMDAIADALPSVRLMTIETSLRGQSQVEVSISDSGTGIPTEKLGEVFDTFYTTKQQGTGLGLSIARTIVETYGGKIWAENQLTGGAVFRFTLPLIKAHAS
jgi:signal transduction histidine kinase